jgi:hypothetical protein
MRDPERIPRILQLLETYWRKHPDLRLGQIVENAKVQVKRGPDRNPAIDTFYVEDEQIEEGLKLLDEFMENFVKPRTGTKTTEQ